MEAEAPTRWRPQAADDGSSSSPEALLATMEADGVLCGLSPKARESKAKREGKRMTTNALPHSQDCVSQAV